MSHSPVPSIRTIPYSNPENTFRATKVSQMWNCTPAIGGSLNVNYNIGIPYGKNIVVYLIKNLTVSNDLQISVELPEFLITPIFNFVLAPQATTKIPIEVREKWVKKLTPRHLSGTVKLSVTPLNVVGPVFIKNDVPISLEPLPIEVQPVVVDELADVIQSQLFVEPVVLDPFKE